MKKINTVLGVVSIDSLGTVLPHEHLLINLENQYSGGKDIEGIDCNCDKVSLENLGYLRRDCYLLRDNLVLDDESVARDELMYFKRAGGSAVVDVTPCGVGRDVRKLLRISEKTGVDIIVGTATYTHDAIPERLEKMTVSQLADFFESELCEGIDGSGIAAGVIGEIGTSEIIYPVEERALRAAALASERTGAPILIHTYPWGKMGLEALKIISEYGIDMKRVCICHVDVKFDVDYIKRIMDTGAWVEFDDFGKEFYIVTRPGEFAGGAFASDVERVRMIDSLCRDGYRDRILVSNDICLKMLLHRYGGYGYDHILSNILPMMECEGMADEDIGAIVRKNPIEFLKG